MRIYQVALLALAALPARATTTYYCSSACGANNESAFNTTFSNLVAGGLSSSGTVNFTGETSGTTVFNVGPTGVDFSGYNGVNPATLNVVGSQLQHTVGGTGTGMVISLPGTILAFGTHVTLASSTKVWCFEATPANACNVTVTLVAGSPSFVGVISDAALSDHRFSQLGTSGLLYTNDFSIAETPEGATFLMVGLGLICLPILKKKMRVRAPGAVRSLQCSP